MSEIKTNSFVRLKGEGRNMLVQRVSGPNAICFWFGDDETFKSSIFPVTELEIVG